MVRVFALAPETLRRMLRRSLWRFHALVTLSFLAFGLYLSILPGPVLWQAAGPIVGIVALASFLIIFFNYRQQLRLLYSVRYELDSSSIVYRQAGKDPQRLMRADIACAAERKDGLWIETVDGSGLLVPYGLARSGDQEIRQTLESWVGINIRDDRMQLPLGRLLLLGLGGSLLVLVFANSLPVILPLGLVVLVYGLWTEQRVTRQLDTAPGQARMYNMAFTFIIFVIIMKSCFISIAILMAVR